MLHVVDYTFELGVLEGVCFADEMVLYTRRRKGEFQYTDLPLRRAAFDATVRDDSVQPKQIPVVMDSDNSFQVCVTLKSFDAILQSLAGKHM